MASCPVAASSGCLAAFSWAVLWPPSLGWPGLKVAVEVSGHALRRLIFGVAVSAARALPVPARCARVVRSVYARLGKLSVAAPPTDVASPMRCASTGSALALRRPPCVVSKPTTTSTAAAKANSVVVTILSLVPYAAIPRAAVMEPAALSTVKFASMDSASAPRGLRVAMYAAETLASAAATA